MKSLTSCAMAELRRQRLLSTELVFHLTAVTFTVPDGVEVRIVVVNLVWFAMLPLIIFAVSSVSCLLLVLAGVSFFLSVVFARATVDHFLSRHGRESLRV